MLCITFLNIESFHLHGACNLLPQFHLSKSSLTPPPSINILSRKAFGLNSCCTSYHSRAFNTCCCSMQPFHTEKTWSTTVEARMQADFLDLPLTNSPTLGLFLVLSWPQSFFWPMGIIIVLIS